jgi:hypothetical protein
VASVTNLHGGQEKTPLAGFVHISDVTIKTDTHSQNHMVADPQERTIQNKCAGSPEGIPPDL